MKKNPLKKLATRPILFMLAGLLMVVTSHTAVTLSAQLPEGTDISAPSPENSIGTFTSIDIPGATTTIALGLNNHGMIVGRYLSGRQTHGFLYNVSGELLTIDYPESTFTVATSINNQGDIVGMYIHPSAPTQRHGFLLKDGVFSTIDPPGSTFTNLLGINDRGDVVGRFCTLSTCRPPGNGDFRGFLLRDGELTMLDVPGAIETDAFKINNQGDISGGFLDAAHKEQLVVWRKNELSIFTLPNGKPVSLDNGGLNERGERVGFYCDSASPCMGAPTGIHGYLISDGEFTTINFPGAVATSVFSINSRGDIVGGYSDATGTHGFLMTR